MGNTKLDPRSLTSEERAWCDAIAVALCSSGNYSAAGAISEAVTLGLPERRALFGEPASEGKVECPNCLQPEEHPHFAGNLTGDGGWYFCPGRVPQAVDKRKPSQPELSGHDSARSGQPASEGGKVEYLCPYCGVATDGPTHLRKLEHGAEWTCNRRCSNCHAPSGDHELCERCESILKRQPAQPESVAAEMPEAVREAARILRVASKGYVGFTVSFLNSKADALESFWRTHAAQPAKVRMTKELRRALDAAEAQAGWHMDQGRPKTFDEIDAAIAAVRSQAAEAVDASAIYDKGFADGIALQKKCAAEAGKVPDCVIHAVRLRRSYLCDLPNSDYGKEQALEMRTIEDWLRAAEGRK